MTWSALGCLALFLLAPIPIGRWLNREQRRYAAPQTPNPDASGLGSKATPTDRSEIKP